MDGERELVERVLGLARPFRVVLGLLTLFELVDGLAIAGGLGEVLALDGDLGLGAAELQRGFGAQALRPLQIALDGLQVVRRRSSRPCRARCAPRSHAAVTALRASVEAHLARGLLAEFGAESLLGALFSALTEVPDPLEPEREGGCLHVARIGRWGLDLK